MMKIVSLICKMITREQKENIKTISSSTCSQCSLCSLYLSIYKGLLYTYTQVCVLLYIGANEIFSENKRTWQIIATKRNHIIKYLNEHVWSIEKKVRLLILIIGHIGMGTKGGNDDSVWTQCK